jgi:hypothetical protein
MAGTGGRDHGTLSNENNRSPVASDEALKRTLERDTAVQGEGDDEGEAASQTRRPADAHNAPPTARPTPDNARSR